MVNNFVLRSMTKNILRTYGSGIRIYLEFCLDMEIHSFSLREDIFILFVTWRTDRVKYNTIANNLQSRKMTVMGETKRQI